MSRKFNKGEKIVHFNEKHRWTYIGYIIEEARPHKVGFYHITIPSGDRSSYNIHESQIYPISWLLGIKQSLLPDLN